MGECGAYMTNKTNLTNRTYNKVMIINGIKFEHPEREEWGDLAAFMKPGAEADELIKKLEKLEFVESVTRAGGFVNIRLKTEYLVERLEKEAEIEKGLKGKMVMVEFAHPNTHKELHIGHMRTLITGEAVARILEESGAKVFRANYQGDIGPHVAKSIWGTMKILSEQNKTLDDWEKESLIARAHLLGEGYIRGNVEYEENKEEIDALNISLYEKDPKWMVIYAQTRKWSLDYYDEFYQKFGTRFDKLYFESQVAEAGKKNVMDNMGKVFEKSEGAIIFDGEKYGLHKRVFITAAGMPTYEGKEVGLAFAQFQDFAYDKIIHVVANEQAGYFKVIIKALEMIDSNMTGRQYHLSMGMVNLVGGKISSRKGEVITVDGLINEVKEAARLLMKDYDEKIVEAVSLGAIKYSVLKTQTAINVAFDLKQSVALDGNSGPYLQYTYARTRSVVRKSQIPNPPAGRAGLKSQKLSIEHLELSIEELNVLRWIYRYPEVVQEAAERYAPNLICNFLYELSQRYNSFYNKYSILNAQSSKEREFRLIMTAAVGEVLKKGLNLLGIEALERM
ncbi:MAG: Arginine-tRNA ligase [Candidatus Amesbacteria bacterium GW2011_GWA2_42_12]|uniref:Arginine--tRNA ligase n=1 Tax=Candidatus Amesbacteria bacterium GW2011_GWA2_42_12 TaxID=1618356 RepID=A0A0G0Y6N5_9BACT|nr:MAG: Arginine-tRNA ligase [Candidatus Amesbacteria bacterium GW2011_GWA2_42_12]